MKTRLAFVVLLFSGGCSTKFFCLNCGESDAGIVGQDGAVVVADSGGMDGAAGDLLHACDPNTVMSDPFNCGSCGNVCSHAHAIPACTNGQCEIEACDVGWIDLDRLVSNDCEYNCLPTGPEICDGVDNDCNGVIDDGFDTNVDPLNCGACGVSCTAVNAVATCTAGHCGIAGCIEGYADLDPNQPGCEYHCPVYPALAFEICNGLDDNCDGQIDEADTLEAAPVGLCSTAINTPCAGTTATCQTRNGVTTWYCNYGAGVEFDPSLPNGLVSQESKCDGLDGDCDGVPDDSFAGLHGTCDNGLLGACRDVGVIICDPSDDTKTKCDLSVPPDPVPGAPMVETCNNVDDNCNGLVDEHTGGAMRLVEDMVHITTGGLNFYIDRYEASRPDATALAEGVVATRSCSNADALPWTEVPFATASAACAAAGLRLCTATEWSAACEGASGLVYPYGNSYQDATCNGADFAATHAILPTGDPTLSMCLSPGGVHDLSGNVKEWTNDQQGVTTIPSPTPTPSPTPQPIYVVRGGAYGSPSIGLTCATTFSRASADTTLPDIGFRCCSSSAP